MQLWCGTADLALAFQDVHVGEGSERTKRWQSEKSFCSAQGQEHKEQWTKKGSVPEGSRHITVVSVSVITGTHRGSCWGSLAVAVQKPQLLK